MLGVSGLAASVLGLTWSGLGLALAAGSIILGSAWMGVGLLFSTSAMTYVGMPMGSYWYEPVSSRFIPARNPDVLQDATKRLTDPTDPSIFLIGLGALTFVLGLMVGFFPIPGLLALVALAFPVGFLLFLPRRAAAARP